MKSQIVAILRGGGLGAILVPFMLLSLPASADPCPKTAKDWENKRRNLFQESLSFTRGLRCRELQEIKNCVNSAEKNIQACMGRTLTAFQYFCAVAQRVDDEDLTLGRKIKDSEYATKYRSELDLPSELKAQPILKLVSRWDKDSLTRIRDLVAPWNRQRTLEGLPKVEVAYYESNQKSGDGGGNFGRMIVSVPGSPSSVERIDRFFQFAVGGAARGPLVVSSIAVRRTADGRYQSYFKDNFIGKTGFESELDPGLPKPFFSPPKKMEEMYHSLRANAAPMYHYPSLNVNRSPRCLSCHISGGPRQIYPMGSPDKESTEVLARMNERFLGYGASRSDEEIVPPTELPPLGADVEALAQPLFDACTDKLEAPSPKAKAVSLEKIKKAMKCVDCHDGNSQPKILPPFLDGRGGVLEPVLRGKMPRDHNLTASELQALARCLIYAYYGGDPWITNGNMNLMSHPGALERWASQSGCTKPGTQPHPSRLLVPESRDHN